MAITVKNDSNEDRKKHSDKETYLQLLKYQRPYRARFILAIITSIPVSLLSGALAWMIGPLFDEIVKTQNYSILTYIPVIILVVMFLIGLFEYITEYLATHVASSITKDLRRELFNNLSAMDLAYFKRHTTGDLFTRYYKDPATLEQAIVSNLQGFIVQFFSMLFLAGVLVYRNWFLAVISLAIMSLIVVPLITLSKKIRMLDYQQRDMNVGLVNRFQELITGIKVIHSFNLRGYQCKRFEKATIEFFSNTMRINKTSIVLKPIMQIIAALGISTILFIGAIEIQNGHMSLGSLASFVVALVLLYKPVKVVGALFGKIQRILAPAERVFELLELTSDLNEPSNPVMVGPFESLVFEDVSFSYEPGKPILQDINFTVRHGETVAIVGPSGGGKTTLVDLIPRFMDPDQGRILLNGISLKDISLKSLRSMISVVSQETVLFEGTIRENVWLGRMDATDADIEKAIDMAYLSDWVKSLPEGLDTPVGERGSLLSGGQRQRIAIARAFLKDAPLLVLDEATSALDSEAEATVQKALSDLMQGKTVIVIAHRLSTIKNADRILVVKQGRIVETGTHKELLARQEGLYLRYYNLQFRHEDEEEETPVL